MKNLRELLLHRRASATPALDALRARALNSLARPAPSVSSHVAAWLLDWRALFREHRVAWAALSCSWLMIGWCHLAERTVILPPHASVKIKFSPAALASASQERRALLQGEEAARPSQTQPAGPVERPRSDYSRTLLRSC